jgi:hypothetical protein
MRKISKENGNSHEILMNNSKEDKKNTLKQLQTLRNSRSRREP